MLMSGAVVSKTSSLPTRRPSVTHRAPTAFAAHLSEIYSGQRIHQQWVTHEGRSSVPAVELVDLFCPRSPRRRQTPASLGPKREIVKVDRPVWRAIGDEPDHYAGCGAAIPGARNELPLFEH